MDFILSSLLPTFLTWRPWCSSLVGDLTGNLRVLSLWGAQLDAGKTGVFAGCEWALLGSDCFVQPQGLLQVRLVRLHFLCSRRLDTANQGRFFFSFLNSWNYQVPIAIQVGGFQKSPLFGVWLLVSFKKPIYLEKNLHLEVLWIAAKP
jgi:hypothetical protein